jgi:ABC-2 type transport system permease protein
MPIIQLLLLSNAATFEVKSAKTYVVDRDQSTASRAVLDRMKASGRFIVSDVSQSMDLANDAMLSRRAALIVSIPADFERDLVRSDSAHVQLLLNAEDGAAAGVTQSYAAAIIAAYAAELRGPSMQRAPPVIDVRAHGWYNDGLRYRDYMVPGILVQLITVVGTLLTAMNIVREKEVGTLDQLNVTPLSRGAFIAAKLIPLWLIALTELTIGLLIARFVFHVPMRGSVVLIFASAGVYLIAALGVGLLVSTVAATQQQAMFVTFFIIMLYLLMSGLFTPVRSMPDWAQWIAEVNPMKHFIGIMRGVMLKGATLTDIVRPLASLTAFGVAMLSLAIFQHGRRAV